VVSGIPDMVVRQKSSENFLEMETRQWDEQAPRYEASRVQDFIYMAGVQTAVAALGARHGDIVLDAGCGTGLTIKQYVRPGISVVALDLSMESLCFLRKTMDGSPVGLVRGDLKALPFADGTFDKVLCANAIQQVRDESQRRQCVRELSRVPRHGGRVVVTAHQMSILKKRRLWPKEGPAGGHSGHVQYIYRHEASEFRALLDSALEVERLTGAGFPLPYRLKLSPVSCVLERLLSRFRVATAWGNMLVGVGRPKAG
jgi:SAM-dependent methyltransferase